jgi:hypothetical protein
MPELLVRAARRALLRTPAAGDAATADDVAATVLEQIVRRHEARSLSALTGRELRAALAQRCRQAAAEQFPRWDLRKQLREHVVRALAETPAGDGCRGCALPLTLVFDGHFCAALVAQGVRALLAAPGTTRRHATPLTAALMACFFPIETSVEALTEAHLASFSSGGEDALVDLLDAPRHAAALRVLLGEKLTRILSLHLAGRKLQEIARAVGLALSTVHGRIVECVRAMAAYAREVGASFVALEGALALLAEPGVEAA